MAEPCINGRHDHTVRQGPPCDRPLRAPSIAHRATGAIAIAAITGLGIAVVAGWKAGEWLATDGRLRLELARRKVT